MTLRAPQNLNEVNNFIIIRVADIWTYYEEWKKRGAEFITEPKELKFEFRCYIRDPDRFLIEIGQTK